VSGGCGGGGGGSTNPSIDEPGEPNNPSEPSEPNNPSEPNEPDNPSEPNEPDIWNGTIDTSWFDENDSPRSYPIDSARKLAGIAYLVNEGKSNLDGWTFTLKRDLDLSSGGTWTPIGAYFAPRPNSRAFEGTVDGEGHTISGMKVDAKGRSNRHAYGGLFGCVASSGTIRRVVLSDVQVSSSSSYYGFNSSAGGVVGYNSGTIENSRSSGSVVSNAYTDLSSAGGIAGYNSGTITDCDSSVSVSSSHSAVRSYLYPSAGGIAGYNIGTIENSHSSGSVTSSSASSESSSFAGGIAGVNSVELDDLGSGMIKNCVSEAGSDRVIKADNTGDGGAYAGGLIGKNNSTRLSNNTDNTGMPYSIGLDESSN
jgi:hypothetical protein